MRRSSAAVLAALLIVLTAATSVARPFVATVLPFLQNAAFLDVLDRQGAAAAAEMLQAARKAGRAAILVSEDEINLRGYRLLRTGAVDDAIAILRINAEAYPDSANTHVSLGEALLAAGKRDGAAAEYGKALAIDPATNSARAALEKHGAPSQEDPVTR